VAKRHKKHRRYGWLVVAHHSPDLLGLINRMHGSMRRREETGPVG
jgi:hypothetical protein